MDDILEKKGRIFNVQKYSIYDGDGIRTLIFLKGCNIRCDWCANPEGLSSAFQVMFSQDRCVNCGKCVEVCPTGVHYRQSDAAGNPVHRIDRTAECIGCRKCEEVCITNALDIVGKDVTVREMMDVIMQDYDFYQASGGGVTLGGGELSLQADFAAALLTQCKKMMINTAIETNGTTNLANYEKLAECTDLFLFDVKHIDTEQHKALFGVGNEGVIRNLERLVELNANIVVRMPLVRGYNDSYDAITGAIHYVMELAKRGKIQRIDILPFHQLGKTKYEKLDMIYPVKGDPSYSDEELDRLADFFTQFDFDIRLVRH
ncbi:choline TMA-lyase-activating enzyme [Pragia fontium]|uniref:Choline trimethylamine-lyase activating enzyme n=2 Tax=Pragia fontium TaxID=82985 RepID=A0AAJ4WC13_9GAMM|nr:choline TMA-lyase-activating enzyme [Pragia fontium]AKJ42542.1 glycyl radical-activating protein [Pragia fontium]SFD11364.1 pyruvate formate lyase activating enzyme [Pragia fontium DSM 5563 = ATCC 49100]SUB82866.1 4-hydroxyphenylacetate decarboxylase activating enzyme [Pragia fontium]VEJ55766.1 4-hydroxyphenylacetate decarboxylase activating enzyme [Pragia fontium]GKX62628.1 choline trimethylamine-lyase activating enzyme [Pragia fontium]